jgi:hypothetical protein
MAAALFLGTVGCDDDPTEASGQTTFQVRIENESALYDFTASGVFNTPVGGASPAPIGPGEAYEFSFSAAPGSKLSFATMFVHSNDFFYAPGADGITAAPGAKLSLATMFVQSNDLFYASGEAGIVLFDAAGSALSGDVTSQLMLWDAGTEVNEEPGIGASQAPRQAGPNSGADESGSVRPVNDGYSYPDMAEVIRVTVTPAG